MIILVDYDNLPVLERQRGLQNIVDKILYSIGTSALSAYQRVRIKLYGGWYERNTLSRRAQQLAADIQHYPKRVSVSDSAGSISLIAQVELAFSIEIDPRVVIEDTYRNRNMPQGLHCDPTPYSGCINKPLCPLAGVHSFINTGICPESGCLVEPTDILYRREQKLVDTMLTADIIQVSSTGNKDICVISSDDDLWPGIKSALLLGVNVFHVHTKPGRTTPRHYSRSVGSNYKELVLR